MLRFAVARVAVASREGQSSASRALLRDLLQAVTGVQASAWRVSAPAGAAPVANAAPGTHAGPVHVSLSHRLGWVAAAVSDAPVGVDIERERPARGEAAERAALMLSASELDAWAALSPADQAGALLAAWTGKEAWFKASAPGSAPWDFRRIAARACPPDDARANVRTWNASPVHVALCSVHAQALAEVRCDGLGASTSSSWHVGRVDSKS